jgi:hypothetical protein
VIHQVAHQFTNSSWWELCQSHSDVSARSVMMNLEPVGIDPAVNGGQSNAVCKRCEVEDDETHSLDSFSIQQGQK